MVNTPLWEGTYKQAGQELAEELIRVHGEDIESLTIWEALKYGDDYILMSDSQLERIADYTRAWIQVAEVDVFFTKDVNLDG